MFNTDHKVTFTISKSRSWSPRSFNLTALIATLPNHKLIYIRTVDQDYDYSKLGGRVDQTLGAAEAAIEFVVQKMAGDLPLRTPLKELALCPRCGRLRLIFLGISQSNQAQYLCADCGGEYQLPRVAGA